MGITASGKRGGNRDVAAKNKRAAELIKPREGPHSKLPEIMPFQSTLAFAFRSVGGVPAAIEAARLVSETDERYKLIVHAYEQLSESDRQGLRLETLCEAAEIKPAEFIGACTSAFFSRNIEIGKLLAVANHPKIVEATIENAQRANGFMDRKMMHDHVGFLPVNKGMQINIDNSKKTLNAGGTNELPQGRPQVSLPSFEAETMEGARALRGDAGIGEVGKRNLLTARPEQEVVVPDVCKIPPPGWYCTREAGHEGPCAAVPQPEVIDAEVVE